MRSANPASPGISSRFTLSADAWFTPGRFAALLALLIFIFFPDVVLWTQTFVYRDFGLYGYPVAFHHRESFWRAEVPLWNPLNNCGVPFLGQWSTLVLYPLSLFYLLFPLSWALGVFCLAHLFLGGMGMYFLAYRCTRNRLAAAVAGVAFAFNGFTLHSLIWPNYMASLGWMPFVVLMAEDAWQKGGRSVVAAAVVGTLQMVAGPPEVILATWLIVGALWIGQCAFGKLPVWASTRRFLLLVLMITGLSVAQLVPFFEFLLRSQRDVGFGTAIWAMPPAGWANLVVPLFDCSKTAAGPYMQRNQGLISSYYLGIGVLALALFAASRLRDVKVWLLGGLAGLGLILALGDAGYVYKFLRQILPQVGFMRYPVKFVMLTTFAVPLLAAYGVGKLLCAPDDGKTNRWRFLMVLWFAMVALILLILWVARYHEEPWFVTARNGLERATLLSLILVILCRIARTVDCRRRTVLGVALLALVWLDVKTHAPSQNPTVAPAVYEPGLQRLQELRPRPASGESRAMPSFIAVWRFLTTMLSDPFNAYLGARLGLFADSNLLDGMPKVDGFYPLYVKEEFETRNALYYSTNAPSTNLATIELETALYLTTNNFPSALADFLGVCQITATGNLLEWEARPTYMPLVTAGQRPIFVEPTNSLRALLPPAFEPRQAVYLPVDAQPFVSVSNQTKARIVSRRFSAHRVVFEVEAQQPSMVVAAQTYYPCWKAYVDGQPTRLWRANHAFQALQAPSGRHSVQLVYRDMRFLAGVAISGMTMIGCMIGLVRGRKGTARLIP